MLKGKNPDRQKELDLGLLISKQFGQAYRDIYDLILDDEISDDDLLSKVNGYYDSQINVIDSFANANGDFKFIAKFRDDAYFTAAWIIAERPRYISRLHLLPEIHCKYPKGEAVAKMDEAGNVLKTVPNLPYQEMNYAIFRISEVYRRYISAYVRNSRLEFRDFGYQSAYGPEGFTPVKDDYYAALSALKVPPVRDWYVTNLLYMAFTVHFSFDESSFVYESFKKICKNDDYLRILEERYQAKSRLQAGRPAPDFELKDENGKTVRLADLKGRIVYLDFWGQGCRACIPELTEHKDRLHEKYKDYDIAYVYIYVTESTGYWKKSIKDYNLQGINLRTEGWWKEDPVCRDYDIQGIPHYVLIDKDGNIVENKCERPSEILLHGEYSAFDRFVRGQP